MAQGEVDNPHITARSITRLYGEKIAKRRVEARLSQKELAEAIGVSQATMSRFESGETQPDYPTLRKMAERCGCKMSTMVPRNQYPSAPLDPAARREFFWRRNAMIQGIDPDEAVAFWSAQHRALSHQRGERE